MKFPFKKFTDDPTLSWEDRFGVLLDHHEEESEFLVDKVKAFEEALAKAVEHIDEHSRASNGRVVKLCDDFRALLGKTLNPAVHIIWGERPLCRFTRAYIERWPANQTAIVVSNLCPKRPDKEVVGERIHTLDQELWVKISCEGCKAELPKFLSDMAQFLDTVGEAMITAYSPKEGQ